MSEELPLPELGLGDDERQRRFDALQTRLIPLWEAIESMDDEDERQTIVVVPSLTVDYPLVGSEIQAYEERYLFLLLLLLVFFFGFRKSFGGLKPENHLDTLSKVPGGEGGL